LTDTDPTRRKGGSRTKVDQLVALVSGPRKPEQIRRAYKVLKALFSSSR
jgi:hypothetical protein